MFQSFQNGIVTVQLKGSCSGCPSSTITLKAGIEALLKRQFDPLVEVLHSLLLKALPHLSRTDIFWRMKFTFGALHHWLLTKDTFLPEWLEETDVEEQTQKLISFAAAGFRSV